MGAALLITLANMSLNTVERPTATVQIGSCTRAVLETFSLGAVWSTDNSVVSLHDVYL
jgi:hypothetical protein